MTLTLTVDVVSVKIIVYAMATNAAFMKLVTDMKLKIDLGTDIKCIQLISKQYIIFL